ncbi:FxsA family protein [Chitinibacter bivalviorum]|uniref:FxsA family protein n=1 Tax=Chitinibacter bivalviorum TaxID=2739434 RepID=A0A7H9BEH8_9NEIS|nr:FxsA family protein [Chitinibacter bivalviorum]QLG86947.1 FxsA family protein [Chitinibacter bivalviorum]
MPYLVFASLLAYPFLEIMSLIWLADAIGTFPMLLIVLLSFGAGVLMLRHQRLGIGLTLMNDIRTGRLGLHSLFSVARYYIAAVLLIVPGLIGDVIALILLLPWGKSAPTVSTTGGMPPQDGVIDGEYRRVDPQSDVDHTQPRIDR